MNWNTVYYWKFLYNTWMFIRHSKGNIKKMKVNLLWAFPWQSGAHTTSILWTTFLAWCNRDRVSKETKSEPKNNTFHGLTECSVAKLLLWPLQKLKKAVGFTTTGKKPRVPIFAAWVNAAKVIVRFGLCRCLPTEAASKAQPQRWRASDFITLGHPST